MAGRSPLRLESATLVRDRLTLWGWFIVIGRTHAKSERLCPTLPVGNYCTFGQLPDRLNSPGFRPDPDIAARSGSAPGTSPFAPCSEVLVQRRHARPFLLNRSTDMVTWGGVAFLHPIRSCRYQTGLIEFNYCFDGCRGVHCRAWLLESTHAERLSGRIYSVLQRLSGGTTKSVFLWIRAERSR